ncbi:DUF6443 domain-containing protein, partial [Salegentibacter sp. JZCK2]|uniref:DUF6443 domain-containing protein n=1 Tax=Salegentibacter tibetensis TaxID=2873600 RepID=UPI001CCEEF56
MKKVLSALIVCCIYSFSGFSQEIISNPDSPCGSGYYEYYRDYDGDGYGDPNFMECLSSSQPGYVSNKNDCNDFDAAIHPYTYWYRDADGDGAGDPNDWKRQCLQPSGYILNNEDCDDTNAAINPNTIWYRDADGDGFGESSPTTTSCTQPVGYVANNDDLCPGEPGPVNGCPEASSSLEYSDENYVFTRIYQNPSSSTKDAIESITYFDGLGRPMQQTALRAGGSAHPSIISTNSWQLGSGSAPFYNQNGSTTENNRILASSPFGTEELLWECGNDSSSNADGGWNTDYFPVDKNASYRYSVWVKRTGSQDGTTYHGTQNVNNLNGTSNSNPYFWSGDMPNVGEWYLLVGVIHPYSYGGGNSGISGVYDRNGVKKISGTDFKWRSTTTTSRLRSYLYYATNISTRQYFWQPVFQKLDGTESSISEMVSKAGKADVVTHISYDQYGRQSKDYLPVPIEDGSFGSYRTADMHTATASYYLDNFSDDFPGMTTTTANPFSEKLLEPSPLNRVAKQAAPGYDWRLGSGHEMELDYVSNGLEEVRLYKVTLDASYKPTLSQNTGLYYAAGELYKTITRDENHPSTTTKNNTTEEFKDKQGRVVLKRTYNSGAAHDTYYVYDDHGNLTYVIPPKVKTSDGISTTELNELCYQYRYDGRNRLIEKRIPGKGNPSETLSGWDYIVYNKLDQPIMTQDPNLKDKNQWLFTKYDAFGRVAYTGIVTRIATRATLQAEADNNAIHFEKRGSSITLGGTSIYYSNDAYPQTYISEVHTENYYDTYLASSAQAGITVPTSNSVGENISTATKGLPTVSKVRVLGTSNWITTVTAYEKMGRQVWTKSVNSYHSTTDLVESDLDFTGKVKTNKTTHSKSGQNTIITIDTYTYDHMGRLKEQNQKVNSNATELIARNTYDEVGQLVQKQVGGVDKGIGLQNVDYSYNVRGWLKQINNPGNLGSDLFGFKLNYNTVNHSGTPLFNGNIAETEWRTANTDSNLKWYRYGYDNLNRITFATANSSNYNVSGISYDKNGNLTNLTRRGAINSTSSSFGNMDVLTYAYHNNGNKLQRVNDTGNGTYGFVNGANLTTEYTYDTNGNMTRDDNKGITDITYNHLNLPTSVSIGGGTISYIYDA